MAEKLTKRLIDAMTYEAGNAKDIRWDSEMAGFGVRLYPSGKKSFVLFYRVQGVQKLLTLGQYGKITLDQARELAKVNFGQVAAEQDPLKDRKASKKKKEWTVKRAAEFFIERYAKEHTKSWKETQRIFETDLIPALGNKSMDEVTKADIIAMLDKITKRGSKTMANRTLAHVRKMFNWYVGRGLIPFSPAFKVPLPSKEISRDRFLNDAELKEVWLAVEELKWPFKDLLRILILTGQRINEVATMQWSDIDKEKKTWTIPRENKKSGREHLLPLPDTALAILEEMPLMGPYVFSVTGKRPFENFSRAKIDLDRVIEKRRKAKKQIEMPHWRFHDLRRTMASGCAKLKVVPHIVEQILDHKSGIISGVAAVYNRYEYFDEMQSALNIWTEHVEAVLVNDELGKSFVGRVKS